MVRNPTLCQKPCYYFYFLKIVKLYHPLWSLQSQSENLVELTNCSSDIHSRGSGGTEVREVMIVRLLPDNFKIWVGKVKLPHLFNVSACT